MTPLLFYPEGVAYLVMKGSVPTPGAEDVRQIAKRVADILNETVRGDFAQFIKARNMGIQVDAKCLEQGVPFADILRVIWSRVERRNLIPKALDEKVRARARREFDKNKKITPSAADEVLAALDAPAPIVTTDIDRLRLAELVRSYYIFLVTHFKKTVEDPWAYVYRLLELPEARWPFYSYFKAREDRAYALSCDLTLSWEDAYQRIKTDGTELMAKEVRTDDKQTALFIDYLERYLVFGVSGRPQVNFGDDLSHYAANQHKQCVYCGGPFPTDKWMSGDVRSDITVQVFSNRLRGGPGEPKKHVCAVCHAQFLLEKINYPEIYKESALYIHIYPYSFLPAPFVESLRNNFKRIRDEDMAVQALNMDSAKAIVALSESVISPSFRGKTKKGKPHPYGLYVPRFSETTGNLVIFPINPGGANDTECFLFALWNALVLQRYFGAKVLLSNSPVSPLGKEDFADLYVDNIPLACEGLLSRNDYAEYRNGSKEPGTLDELWTNVQHLFALRSMTFASRDETPTLVRALTGSPLRIFYETEKLIERRISDSKWLTANLRRAFEHVEALALNKGGSWMAKLSEELRRLAEIARRNWIAGSSWKKSSLLFPIAEIFDKLGQAGRIADLEALRAATAQDIFDHLVRIAKEGYKPGRKKLDAVKSFVDGWYDGVLGGIYNGDLRRLQSDEKLIRSAYLFYFSEVSRAEKSDDLPEADDLTED